MAYARTIIFLLFVCVNTIAQPLAPAELAFGSRNKTNGFGILPPVAFPAFFAIPNGSVLDSNVTAIDPQNFNLIYHTKDDVTNGFFVGPTGPLPDGPFFFWNPAGYIGLDGFTYYVDDTFLQSTAKVDLLVYATNGTTCGNILTGTNFVLQLPPVFVNQDRSVDVYVYETSWFTNYIHHLSGDFSPVWMVSGTIPTIISCFSPSPNVQNCNAIMTFPTNGTVCIVVTNTFPPNTNFCGTNLTDNLSNVVWSANSLGAGLMSMPSATNGVVYFDARLCSVISGQGGGVHYSICGGPTNRTVLVTGLITNITQNLGDNASVNLNNTLVTNFPAQIGNAPVVYPISFSYTITGQQTNIPEYEFLMIKHTSAFPPNNCNSISGVLTNTLQ